MWCLAKVAEKLEHLRERVASLEDRLAQVEARDTTVSTTDPRANTSLSSWLSSEPQHEPMRGNLDPEKEVTKKVLDRCDMVTVSESVWDACLFIGLGCVGTGVSAVLMLVYILNLCLQVGFTAVVYTTLVEDPLGPETMDDILRFHLGVAHSAKFANSVFYTSMISQMCGEDHSLHTAALQASLFGDLSAFGDGGVYLCVLSQIAWLVLTMVEINDSWNFMLALWSVPRGESTKIFLAHNMEDGFLHDKLEKITVVTRLVALKRERCLAMFLFVVAPRLLIAIVLGITGSLYLSLETDQQELILNVVALTFVVSLDEELYKGFVPRRARVALANMEPLRVETFRIAPSAPSLLKMGCVACAVLIVSLTMIGPLFENLSLAQDILCSGNTDFIYAVNPASGVIHVARTMSQSDVEEWSLTEKAIFQMAKPQLRELNGWTLDPDLAVAASWLTLARVQPDRSVALENTHSGLQDFNQIVAMTSQSVTEGSQGLACVDLDAGASNQSCLWEVRAILGNSDITGCDDDLALSHRSCARPEMSRFRALCPVTCGCRDVWNADTGVGVNTGWPATVFGPTAFGCPASCTSFRTAVSAFLLAENNHSVAIGTSCMDVPPQFLTNRNIDFRRFPSVNPGGPIEYDFNSIYIPRWLHGYMEGLLALLLRDSSFSERVWRQAQVFEAWLGTRAVWRPCGHHRQRNLGVDAWISAPS